MKNKRAYAVYDVFSDTAYAGNPLAVVFDATGLDTAGMQRIAAEFNLSETVFVLPPEDSRNLARLRIFMPKGELPFAGHPTVGGAVALCQKDRANEQRELILEEAVGDIRCSFMPGKADYAHFELPVLPQPEPLMMSTEAAADALGLDTNDVGFDQHITSQWNAGKAYLCIPVKDVDTLQQAVFNETKWLSHFPSVDPLEVDCPYLYCRQKAGVHTHIQSRMFAPHHGIPEDPATGSAAAALAGALQYYDDFDSGTVKYEIAQGIEMNRPSRIYLEINAAGNSISAARIGGNAVKVAEGFLLE